MGDIEVVISPLSENEDILISPQECPICFIEETVIYKMPCCKNILCHKCYIDWHINQKNGTCVFCRNLHLEYETNDINDSVNRMNPDCRQIKTILSLWIAFTIYAIFLFLYIFKMKEIKGN